MSGRFGNRANGSGNRYEHPASRNSISKTHQPRERIDYVLDLDGWFRKRTPKDASCVFRVVAEQVFQNHPLYPLVRRDCVRFMKLNWAVFSKEISSKDTCEQYLKRLQSDETYATDVEMLAMSMLYKRDFVIYHHDKSNPEERTHNFTDKIRLCRYGDNHYDSVVRTEELLKAGIAQAIVYEIQYAMIFKLGSSVTILKDLMLNEPKTSPGRKRFDMRKEAQNLEEGSLKEKLRELLFVKERRPLPYEVAESLSPHIYQDVNFDVWIEERELVAKRVAKLEQEAGFTADGPLVPGALCWISRDPNSSENGEGEWGVVQQCVTKFSVWVASTREIEDFRKDQLKYRRYENGSISEYQKDEY